MASSVGDDSMKCPTCHHDNPQDALFCMNCGRKLERKCLHCGFELPEHALFCMNCGKKLVPEDPPADDALEEIVPDAERRQLTVMFCDLVGSATLSEKLDPEDLREVIGKYQETCNKVIRRFDGHIAQYLGDGLLVYFGYPQAHEDDAQRAARTGLAIIEAVSRLNPSLREQLKVELSVRVGIHTGLVVTGAVGEGSTRENLAIGETPNIAARLQGEAEPNTVLVSAATYQLIEGFFACQEPHNLVLKGFSQPMDVCQIDQVSTARILLDPVTTALPPIVGREQETGLLFERWQRINEGMGQAVLLSGDAGIGKSRLVKILEEHVAQDPQAWLMPCQCSAYHQNSAFYPVIHLLERSILQFEQGDGPTEKLSRLEGFLVQYGIALPEVVPVFSDLLSMPLDQKYPSSTLSPERQKLLIFETMLGVLLEIASRQPLLLVMEDLHWADPTTLEFLNLIVDQLATTRIFALFTFRPDFNPPWGSRAYLTILMLHRLTQKKCADMVRHIAGGKALPDEVLEQILIKTDGVPLFVEELTKMVLESGLLREEEKKYTLTGRFLPLKIPMTLQDSLTARLDRLSSAKELAQLCAILGREFSAEMLLAILPRSEEMLRQGLGQLIKSELLYQRGVFPRATYVFKHALIQEAAYQSMLKNTRRRYHRQIAEVLVKQFPESAAARPEIIAHHYTEAGLKMEAISYWQQAGERAVERFANEEAIAHLTKGLELIEDLPKNPERSRQELMLQLALGPPLSWLKGFAAPEVEAAYSRALNLNQQTGGTLLRFPALWGMWHFYVLRAEFSKAVTLSEQLINFTHTVDDTVPFSDAYRARGETFLWTGEFSQARTYLEKGIVLDDGPQQRNYNAEDPGVACRFFSALAQWFLGYPDQALQRSHEAVTLAKELSHPLSLSAAHHFKAFFHLLRREGRPSLEQAEAAMAIATDQGFGFFIAFDTILRGWALAELGESEEGVSRMLQGLAAYRETGAEALLPQWLAALADSYGKLGQVQEGLDVLADTQISANKNNGERYYIAEILRLKGKLLMLGIKDTVRDTAVYDESETYFLQAIEVAQQQNAKSLELRAAVSLSRLWQRQGKKADAFGLLSKIYNWFEEGFDTPDLKAAKVLLEELS
jgi:class 3 adenylate cyclase/predicted ATPase